MGQSDTSRLANTAAPPGVLRISSDAEARELAHRLLTPRRRWPVVVLTVPGGNDEPFGDPDEIKEAVGDLAEVVLMPTGAACWSFSDEMPARTQVYGGAGRVYPVDHDWVLDPARSRLRFAYSLRDRRRITDQLISDALQAALAAGLVERRNSPGAQRRSGRVQGIIGSRALVSLDDRSTATVWEELTVPGVPLERVLTGGQWVTGSYDRASRRLDLRDGLRFADPARALAAVAQAYQAGDVVLADVAAVTDDAVRLRLLPDLAVEVGREAVTTNPHDALTGLFTIGEIITCRVVAVDPVRLRLDDIDDEEEPRPALSLLPDGPPWLRPPEPGPQPAAANAAQPSAAPPQRAAEPSVAPAPLATPLELARRIGAPSSRPAMRPAHGVPLQEQAHLTELSNELAAERATRKTLAAELADLRDRAAHLEGELDDVTRSLEQLRTRYRRAVQASQRALEQIKKAQSHTEHPSSADQPLFSIPRSSSATRCTASGYGASPPRRRPASRWPTTCWPPSSSTPSSRSRASVGPRSWPWWSRYSPTRPSTSPAVTCINYVPVTPVALTLGVRTVRPVGG